MARRKGKSWNDLERQMGELTRRALASGNRERVRRIGDIASRYQSRIEKSKSYRSAMRAAENLADEEGNYNTKNANKANEIMRNADNRRYSRNTYMGLNKG